MNKIIFLVAGGTGGHLFPAIAVSKYFKKSQLHFLVDRRIEKILLNNNIRYHLISSSKLEKNIFKVIISLFKIFYGFIYSLYLIVKFKPALVVGFGGYTSIPTLLAAKILNKQIRIGRPRGISGLAEAMDGPAFSVNAGLLAFAVDDQGEIRQTANNEYRTTGSLFGRLGDWFRENF